MRTSRHLKPFATALLCTLVFGPACLAQGPLDCSALQSSMLWNEASALATAPHGATRSIEHRLDVRWSHGIRSFVDVAPYGIGDAAGIRYDDCGYEARTGMHLVYRYNEDEVNGLLLHDGTGALLPAGYTVTFLTDHRRYLAVVQSGGMDGQEWRIYSRDGQLLLKGPTVSCDDDFRCTALSNPHWTAAGDLEADHSCGRALNFKEGVLLRLGSPSPKWSWASVRPCRSH